MKQQAAWCVEKLVTGDGRCTAGETRAAGHPLSVCCNRAVPACSAGWKPALSWRAGVCLHITHTCFWHYIQNVLRAAA